MARRSFVSALLLTLLTSVWCDVGLPVVIWSSSSSLKESISKPFAGHILQADRFEQMLGNLPTPDLAIVFVQDQLSSEDFMRFGGGFHNRNAFKYMQSVMKDGVYLPSVKHPLGGLLTLKTRFEDFVELSNSKDVAQYLESTSLLKNTLCVVHLASTVDNENMEASVRSNDELIGTVMRRVAQSGLDYVAVYTGKSHRKISDVVAQGSGRRLMAVATTADNDTTYLWNVSPCTVVYVEDVVLNYTKPGATNRTVLNITGENTKILVDCQGIEQNTTALATYNKTITLTFSSTDVNIIMEMAAVNGTWVVSLIKTNIDDEPLYNYTEYMRSVNKLGKADLSGPLMMGYHCAVPSINTFQTNSTKANLTFGVLQLQPFQLKNGSQFGYGYDCVGYYTIPIWTALLTLLLLLTVTLGGMGMLSQIQTFDQFDDHNTVPLTINISE